MPTFLDLYTRMLDEVGDDARSEAESLVTKMCASPPSSPEHQDARRGLAKLYKSRVSGPLPRSWRADADPEADLDLRKDFKAFAEQDGVFFWGRVPEWDEIEKHYGDGDHRHPSKYHNPKPTQRVHGNEVGHRHMAARLIVDKYGGNLAAFNRDMGLPEDTPFRDIVAKPEAGGPLDTEKLRASYNKAYRDGEHREAADEGTQAQGENFKLSATVGSPQDAADVHQEATVRHEEAGHVVESLRDEKKLKELLDEQGSLTEWQQKVQSQLKSLGGYKSVRGVVGYMERQAARRSQAQGRLTAEWNKMEAGKGDDEAFQKAAADAREAFTDYRAAFGVLQHRIETEPELAEAVGGREAFVASQEKALDKAAWQLGQVTAEETRRRAPGAVRGATPHPVGAAHGLPGTKDDVESHNVVPREATERTRARQPERVSRLRIPGRPGEEPAKEPEPQKETVQAPPARRLPERAPSQRLPEPPPEGGKPAPAPAPKPAAPAAGRSDADIADVVASEAKKLDVTLSPDGQRKMEAWVRKNPDLEGEALTEAFTDRVLGNEDTGVRGLSLGDYKAVGDDEGPEEQEGPPARLPTGGPSAPAQARPRPRTGGGAAPGQQLPGMAGLMGPSRTDEERQEQGRVRTSFLPGATAAAREYEPGTPLGRIEAETLRWRRELKEMVSRGDKPKGTARTPAEVEASLDRLMESVKAKYKSKDADGIVSDIKDFVKESGFRAGTGNWYSTISRALRRDLGLEKASRLPLPGDVPTRLSLPGEMPDRLPLP